jgi:PAS domain S-box-containing protein
MPIKENYYLIAFDNLLEGIQVLDFDWRYIYVNDALIKSSMFRREELIGYTIQEKYPGIEQTELWTVLEHCMKNRVSKPYESEFIFPGGKRAFFELSIQPVPEGLLILSIDRSEFFLSKKQLQISHERLLFHVKHTPLGFIQWNAHMQIEVISERTEEIFGWNIQSFQQKKNVASLLIHKDYVQEALNKTRELLRGEVESNKVLLCCHTKYGHTIWCEWFNSAVKNKEGKVVTIMSLVDDVTREKVTENNLFKINRLYAFLSATNQSILHTKTKQELFDSICTIATEIGKFKTAWIALLNGKSKLVIVSIKGDNHTGFDYLHYSGMDFTQSPFQNTTIAKVLTTRQYAVSNDVQNDPDMKMWGHIYERLGVKSSMTLPLLKNNAIIGVVGFNSTTRNFFDDEEIFLLTEAASDIGYAIELIEQEEKHKLTEKLVENNEKRFRALTEKSQDMKTLSAVNGKFIYCSPSITKMLGYTIKEFLQKNIFDLMHSEDIPGFIAERKSIMREPGSFFSSQIRIKHKQEHWVWCECTITNQLHDPAINAIVANFIDVSEKKLAEQRRLFDQNNLNALINSTPDLMWSVYTDYTLITFNQPFETMVRSFTGKPVLQGSDVRKLNIPIEKLHRMKVFYTRAFNGESFTEIQYVDKPNEAWYEISFAPIYKNSDVIGAACHSRNITRRKTIEQQLRKSETFNKGVIDSLTAHIAVINNSGNIIAVNEAWKRFAATNPDTALLRAFMGNNYINNCTQAALAGDTVAAEAVNGIVEVMNKKKNVFYLEYPCTADGKNYWFAMRVMQFESDDSLMVISHHDISLRKQAELERTDIVNALVQRNKDLEQFSYIVSHNLRAPVANIIGAADIINEPGLSQEDRETLIKGLGQSSKRLDEVLKDMNFILKVRDVNNQIKEKVFLSELFDTVTGDIHYLTDDNNIIITGDFDEVNELYSFRTYLYSIFYNLITNSIKYRQYHKQTFINVSSRLLENNIQLIFKDNGIGINLEKKGKEVFGLYKRFHHKIEGRGMGLFLVKTQVETLGGTISLDSKENVGSEFIITFPV